MGHVRVEHSNLCVLTPLYVEIKNRSMTLIYTQRHSCSNYISQRAFPYFHIFFFATNFFLFFYATRTPEIGEIFNSLFWHAMKPSLRKLKLPALKACPPSIQTPSSFSLNPALHTHSPAEHSVFSFSILQSILRHGST